MVGSERMYLVTELRYRHRYETMLPMPMARVIALSLF